MAKLAQEYRKSPEAIVAYNYTDIAEGTGIVTFYGASNQSGWFLTQNTLYSMSAATTFTGQTNGTLFNQDMDVTFNLAKDIKGKLIANVPVAFDNSTVGNKTPTIAVTVYHYDGSTATQLATASGSLTATPASTNTPAKDQVACIILTIAQKHFKAGHTLRINVTVTLSGTGTGAVGHDPGNRLISPLTVTSRMAFYVPFVLLT